MPLPVWQYEAEAHAAAAGTHTGQPPAAGEAAPPPAPPLALLAPGGARVLTHEPQHPALAALARGRLGVCFSGAGFGAAYQLGAAQVLQQLGVLSTGTPLSGASAGCIVAAAVRCGVPPLDVLDALVAVAQVRGRRSVMAAAAQSARALRVLTPPPPRHTHTHAHTHAHTHTRTRAHTPQELRSQGLVGRMAGALRPQLERLLPPDAHTACSGSSSLAAATATGSNGGGSSSSAPRYHPTPPQQPAERHPQWQPRPPTAAAPFVVAATRLRGPCPVCPPCWQPDVFDGGLCARGVAHMRMPTCAARPTLRAQQRGPQRARALCTLPAHAAARVPCRWLQQQAGAD
jgi:hypothetical protein